MAIPTVTFNTPNSGRQAPDNSQAVVLSVEDKATLDGILNQLGAPISYLPPEPVVAVGDKTLTRAPPVDVVDAADTTIVAGAAGQVIRLHRFSLSISGACTLTWKSGGVTLWAKDFPSAADWEEPFASYPWVATAAGETLVLTTSAPVAVKGFVDYVMGA